jgi:hypothetical protein
MLKKFRVIRDIFPDGSRIPKGIYKGIYIRGYYTLVINKDEINESFGDLSDYPNIERNASEEEYKYLTDNEYGAWCIGTNWNQYIKRVQEMNWDEEEK